MAWYCRISGVEAGSGDIRGKLYCALWRGWGRDYKTKIRAAYERRQARMEYKTNPLGEKRRFTKRNARGVGGRISGLQNEPGSGCLGSVLGKSGICPRVGLQNELEWAGASAYPPFALLQNELCGGCGHDFFLCQHGLAQGLEFQEHVEVDLEVLRQLLLVGRDV